MILTNKTGEAARIFKDSRNPRRDLINIGKLCINNVIDLLIPYNEFQYDHQYDFHKDEESLTKNYDVMYFFNLYYDLKATKFSYIDAASLFSESVRILCCYKRCCASIL